MAVALAQPHRRGERDPRLGYALGRLYYAGALTPEQHEAGLRYTRLAIRYMREVTGSLPMVPGAAIAERVSSGLSTDPDLPDEDIFALRRAWADVCCALADVGRFGTGDSRVLTKVCIMDKPPEGDGQRGALRECLNVLCRLWRTA